LARHGTLAHEYYAKYPECYDLNIDEKLIIDLSYNGQVIIRADEAHEELRRK
jgi:hypothetical protein